MAYQFSLKASRTFLDVIVEYSGANKTNPAAVRLADPFRIGILAVALCTHPKVFLY